MAMVLLVVALVGLLIGACLNVLIIRIPKERSFQGVPKCTRCNRPLMWWQWLPVIGWLVQGGKARCCGRQLNLIFPIVEILYAAALTAFAARYQFSPTFFYLALIAAVLIVTGAIDWLHRYIYTLFILAPALIVLILASFIPGHSFLSALVGALVGGFVFTLLFFLAHFLFPAKSAPFGLGDVYLSIFIGAAVGIIHLMPALFYGILLAGLFSLGILVARKMGKSQTEYIAYGSFLCLGTLGYLAVVGI